MISKYVIVLSNNKDGRLQKGYGEIRPGRYTVGKYSLLIHSGKDVVSYQRIDLGKKETVESQILSGYPTIILVPFYPVMLPKRITPYILIEFTEKLRIPPNTVHVSYIYIPVDYAIYAYKEDKFDVIDVFEEETPKFAVYGNVINGLIARYSRSGIYDEMPKTVRGKAVARITFNNETNDWVTVSMILVDSNHLSLFYRQHTWEAYTQSIEMIIRTKTIATVRYGFPIREDLERIDDPKDFKPPKISMGTEMLWGI